MKQEHSGKEGRVKHAGPAVATADAAGLSEDLLLGGKIRLLQPRRGQRASADAVMLAAAVPARSGQSVLELGCGSGVAMLCLGARIAGVRIDGVELLPDLAALAIRNITHNGLAGRLTARQGDIRARRLPGLTANSYDHVFANPPYFDTARHRVPADAGRAAARIDAGAADTAAWIQAMLRFAKPGGRLTLIQRTERLPELLAALAGKAGGITIRPLHSKTGQPAKRLILQAVKGGRAPMVLAAGLVLHDTAGGYRPEIDAVLRSAAALPEPGQT